MAKSSVNFTNSRLGRQLRALPREIEREAARAVADGARLIRDEAVARVRSLRKSGRLAAGIRIETDASGHSARVVAGPGTGVDYARALEFGSARRAARPFLFPAFERVKPRIMERFREAVAAALKKAVRHS